MPLQQMIWKTYSVGRRFSLTRSIVGRASLLAFCAMQLAAADYYVAADGSAKGDGSVGKPWNLPTALAQPPTVQPGDTIWLRGGTYTGIFTSVLTGAPGRPIILRQYPGERAILDAATQPSQLSGNVHTLNVQGAYTWYWGFEVLNSSPAPRQVTVVYNNYRGDGLWITGHDTKFINLIIHDTDQGVSYWEPAQTSELYGNLIYNNGWIDPLRGRGHNIYAQNQTGTRLVSDNILYQGFDHGIQVYGSDQAHLDNFVLQGNIATGNLARSYLIGGQGNRPALNPVLDSNYSYAKLSPTDGGNANNLGYASGSGCSNPVVTNNYFGFGGLRFVSCTNIKMTGNTFYGVTDFYGSDLGLGPSDFPNNTYYGLTRPTGIKVFVRPNKYETGRANIAIFNWDLASTVSVDISGVGLQPGDAYELHNAEDYFNDVVTGVWNGGPLQVTMTGHTAASPLGLTAWANTYPEFGVFIMMKASGGPVVQPVATPVISPAGGIFSGTVAVTIGTSTQGAQIRYTTDGSDPNQGSTLYSGPISVSTFTTIRARGFKVGSPDSDVAIATFTRNRAAAPLISPGGGTFSSSAVVVLSSTTSGASIRFTLDGTVPSSSSPVYSAPISLTGSTIVRAQATASGMDDSAVTSATFTISSASTSTSPSSTVPTAGLKMWLRSDTGVTTAASNVSRWADQSGSGTDAVQSTLGNQPVIVPDAVNGKPAIRFDGTASFMNFVLPLNNLTGMTVLMVTGRVPNLDGNWNGTMNSPLFWDETTSWGCVHLSPFQNVVKYRFGTTLAGNLPAYTRPKPLASDAYTLTSVIKNGATEQLFVGGQPVYSETGKYPTIEGASDLGSLGRGYANSYYLGDIVEVLVYDRALTDSERQLAEAYVLAKYFSVSAPKPPMVNAGGNQTVTLPASAQLNGSVSDPDSPATALSSLWRAVSGPGTVQFGTASSAATSASFSVPGTYVLRLTASDGTFSATSDVTITVQAPSVASTVTSGQPFVTAFTGTTLRNDFGGWVGMKLTMGGSLSVSALGRLCVAGNSGLHTAKLVSASTGDVPGGSVSLNMSGCTPGQFVYGALANSITLSAGGNYFLASQEFLGGDRWYDYKAPTTTPVAAISAVYSSNGTTWLAPPNAANTSFVSVNFLYSGGADTTGPFVTGFSTNVLRNDYNGWVGMKLTAGGVPKVVSALGRICVLGNSGAHTVKLVDASTGLVVPGASVSLNMSGCTAGQFVYGSVTDAFTLEAGASYYLVSQEFAGGDRWNDYGPVATTPVAFVSAIYSATSSIWLAPPNSANAAYVPLNLK